MGAAIRFSCLANDVHFLAAGRVRMHTSAVQMMHIILVVLRERGWSLTVEVFRPPLVKKHNGISKKEHPYRPESGWGEFFLRVSSRRLDSI